MSKEKQIEIEVITYEQDRLNYFTDLMEKAQKSYDRLYKKYKDSPYLFDGTTFLSDAGRELSFYKDVVEMLKQGYRKQKEGEWIKSTQPPELICNLCGAIGPVDCLKEDFYASNFCPDCGAKMKGAKKYLAKNNVVVLPCDIGDKLYAIYDGTDEDVRDVAKIEELTVTEIGTSRIFCSSYVPPRDDISFEIPIRELGVKYFFVREDAEQMLKGGGE